MESNRSEDMDLIKPTIKICLVLTCLVTACKQPDESETKDFVFSKGSLFSASMEFAPGDDHGRMTIFHRKNDQKLVAVDACIGEKLPCSTGNARTFKLIRRQGAKASHLFDFPVKVSLLANTSVQITAKWPGGVAKKETFQITNDWTKGEAKKVLAQYEGSASLNLATDPRMTEFIRLVMEASGGGAQQVPAQVPTPTTPMGGEIPQTQPTTPQPPSQPAGPKLNVGQYYNQGQTNYCWAYSMVHSLRDYYGAGLDQSADGDKWRQALSQIDSPQALSSYLQQNFPNNNGGMPDQLLSTFSQQNGLSSSAWSRGQGIESIQQPLSQGKPVPLCSPNGARHCVAAIRLDGQTVTIADSAGGHTYQESMGSLSSSPKVYTWTLVPQ
jgi:hypothetical protein